MFSGQGSQYYHMAKELFAKQAVFRMWMLELDKVVRNVTGCSTVDQIYNEQKTQRDLFDCVLFTHPAIFMVEYALAQLLIESGIEPHHVFGASMGEFAASALAGVMSAEQSLELLLKQAQLFQENCTPGAMLAIIANVSLYHDTPFIRNNAELASINYDSHFVISGKRERLREIERDLKHRAILYQSLPVSYGYHSSFIDPAAAPFKEYLKAKACRSPGIPFVSGLYGTSLSDFSPEYFWDVVRQPIQLPKAIREMERRGDNIYIDLGPSGTLANFVKRNLSTISKSESHAIITPFHQELKNLEKIANLPLKK